MLSLKMVRIIPLCILAGANLIGLGIVMGKHEEERPNYNFGHSLIAAIIDWSLILWAIL